MPLVEVQFFISHVLEGNYINVGSIYMSSLSNYREIIGLFYPEEKFDRRGRSEGSAIIKCDVNDPRLQAAYEILKRNGFTPTTSGYADSLLEKGQFRIRMCRSYTEEEIASAELLHANADVNYRIADSGGAGDDETGWLVLANAKLKQQRQFGSLGYNFVMLFGDELKQHLENSNLHGLSFMPVHYDKPERAVRQLWQIAQNNKMPPCLVPRLSQSCYDFREEIKCGAKWYDEGYSPVELKFRRKNVDAMQPFDVATTIEKVGSNPGYMHTQVIVTQRFREVMKKAKVKGINYFPVRLLD